MRRIFFLIISIAIITSCNDESTVKKKLKTLTHKNGMSFQISDNVKSISETKNGYLLNLLSSGSRQINEIKVKLIQTPPKQLASFTERMVDKKKYYSLLTTFSGGSGGAEYELKIWNSGKSGGVLLTHNIQQDSKPDFNDTWELMKSVSFVDDH